MFKKIVILLIINLFFLLNTTIVSAKQVYPPGACDPGDICCNTTDTNKPCVDDGAYACTYQDTNPRTNTPQYTCQKSSFAKTFGKIKAPDPIKGLLNQDPTGAGGISIFLSNLIALIYSIAGIVLIFMLLWGAFEWMTSGGDKEKIEAARRRIISAMIGMLLFAIAFAVIQILGAFTGFRFFKTQNLRIIRNDKGIIIKVICPDGQIFEDQTGIGSIKDPYTLCKETGHGT